MCKIAHKLASRAANQQRSFPEKNSSRRCAIVRLQENFSISRFDSHPEILQGAEEKWQNAPYSLDSYPR